MSTATSSTDIGTPVHAPSAGASRSPLNDRVDDHYLASEQLDDDEAIDLGDHVTGLEDGHVTQRMKLSISDESNEDQSTAEEGRDSLPNYESTTTDNIAEPIEPVDFIETNPRLHSQTEYRFHANGAVIGSHGNSQVPPPPPGHRYENWNVELQIEDGSRRGRSSIIILCFVNYGL